MIFIGQAFEENKEFNYTQDYIRDAREKIKEFPTLKSISRNFQEANKENYNKNYFLILARNAVFVNGPQKIAEDELKNFERLVKFVIPKLDRAHKNELISRLSGYGDNHFKAILQLKFYDGLLKNNEIQGIEYEPKSGTHDFSLKIKNTEFNLELTSLGSGEVDKILTNAFNEAANEILNQIEDGTLLQLNVNTNMLLQEEGNNSSHEIKNTIIQNYKKFRKIIHIVRNNHCIIGKNLGSPDKSLYDIKDYYKHYSEFGERLSKLMETEEGLNFLRTIKIKDIHETPFSSFVIGDSKTRLVEIHSTSMWPSKAEELRKKSLLKRLRNSIAYKITKGQLKGKINPILVINFSDVVMFDYTSVDYFGQEHFKELKEIIENSFKKTKEKTILGVILYENSLIESKFVSNPNIQIDKDILCKIAILAT